MLLNGDQKEASIQFKVMQKAMQQKNSKYTCGN